MSESLVCSTTHKGVRVNLYRDADTNQLRYSLVYGRSVLWADRYYCDSGYALEQAREAADDLIRYGSVPAMLSRPCGGRSAWERSVGL